jgi:selenocysteine lyase/cysteine desulfurase
MSITPSPKLGHALLKDFLFDPTYRNLNHGSFGTYPRAIREKLREYQDAAEARPDRFIRYDAKVLLDESRAAVANLLNVPTDTCVLISNATTGVGTVLRNLVYEEGDVIVYFDTIYGACGRAVLYVEETTPVEAVKVQFTYPVSDDWLVNEFKRVVKTEQAKGKNVRLAIYDTVVSLPGVRMPFEALTEACRELGVMSCVDGAHGVGHLELDLSKLDPDFFVSNCHKYAPPSCRKSHIY